MASSYRLVGPISLGIVPWARRLAVMVLGVTPNAVVYDLMSGTGESWHQLLSKTGGGGRLIAIDSCPAMTALARERANGLSHYDVRLACADVMTIPLPDAGADAVLCAFGLKTVPRHSIDRLAERIGAVLRPGGTFAVVELRIPCSWFVRRIRSWYCSRVVPKLFLLLGRNPGPHMDLDLYLADRRKEFILKRKLTERGMIVSRKVVCFGCAVILWGTKPCAGSITVQFGELHRTVKIAATSIATSGPK